MTPNFPIYQVKRKINKTAPVQTSGERGPIKKMCRKISSKKSFLDNKLALRGGGTRQHQNISHCTNISVLVILGVGGGLNQQREIFLSINLNLLNLLYPEIYISNPMYVPGITNHCGPLPPSCSSDCLEKHPNQRKWR